MAHAKTGTSGPVLVFDSPVIGFGVTFSQKKGAFCPSDLPDSYPERTTARNESQCKRSGMRLNQRYTIGQTNQFAACQ